MKNLYKTISFLFTCVIVHNTSFAQCTSSSTLGTSSNAFGVILNNSHPVSADKALNSIVFLHRNDAGLFGGNSGQLRYDLTTNGATTWTNNLGVVNPLNSALARYPNAAIYNPTSNTNPMSAYMGYFCPTTNGTTWVGDVSGVTKLDGTGITETYNQAVVVTGQIPRSMVKSTNNVFWASDPIFTPSIGYLLYKGVWNSSTNDIVWATSYTFTPPYFTGSPSGYEPSIAFDPTGMIGWFSFSGHVTGGSANAALHPVLYKTTDGGNTWTGPYQPDLSKLSCINNNVTAGVASANLEHDLIVDVNGNPHFLTTVGSASSYVFNYSSWHHMYDITLKNGLWVAYDIGNVQGGLATTTSTGGNAVQYQAPQASRSADGTKLFFTWTDNSTYSLGNPNTSPNAYARGFNVTNETWTQVKDFSSCNTDANGKVFYPHMAPEVLEPTSSSYKLAYVYMGYTIPGDLLSTVANVFLNNMTFSNSEFTVTVPPAPTPTISGVPIVSGTATALYCPNSTITINIGNAGQAIWSNSATTTSLSIYNPTVSSYTAIAQVGCNTATTSIIINTLNITAAALIPSICPGSSAQFTVTGNAYSYTWAPSGITGTNVTLSPTSSLVTVMASGDGCTATYTAAITILPNPTITVAGNNTICAGSAFTLTANGAASYLWDNTVAGATFTDLPTGNTTYSVVGTDVNLCVGSTVVSVYIKPTPTINAGATATAICAGQGVTLTAMGAVNYTWNSVGGSNSYSDNPMVTTTYTVTGAGSNSCTSTRTVSIVVYALPSITITPARSHFCKGEKMALTASGANTYTWVTQGALNPSVTVQPTVTTTYSINGLSSDGCFNSVTYTLTVNACTGINELNGDSQWAVYPNPNNGEFIISSATNLEARLINELGQQVMIISLNELNDHKVSVRELPAGIYFITALHHDRIVTQKIVVDR